MYEGETQLINLAIATEQALESDEMHEKNLVGELESLKVKKGKSTAVLTDFKRDFDGVKEMHDELVIQDKQLEKSFRRDFQVQIPFCKFLFLIQAACTMNICRRSCYFRRILSFKYLLVQFALKCGLTTRALFE